MDGWQFNRLSTKRKNRMIKAVTKKPEQEGICRFIFFKDIQHPKVNGHFTHHPIFTRREGLQIEHNFYYIENGKIKRAMINKRGAKVLSEYSGIPKWADELLIKKYNEYINKKKPITNDPER